MKINQNYISKIYEQISFIDLLYNRQKVLCVRAEADKSYALQKLDDEIVRKGTLLKFDTQVLIE